MRLKTLLRIFVIGLLAGAVGAVVALIQFRGSAVTGKRELYVSRRADYAALTDSLLPSLRHKAAFRLYARRLDLANTFKPGHYRLTEGMNVIEVARMLKLGQQTPVQVTINNVRTPAQLAGKVARQLDASGSLTFGVDQNLKYNVVYRLTETTAPEGFLLDDTPIYLIVVKVSEGEADPPFPEGAQVCHDGSILNLYVYNRRVELPTTGGTGKTLFTLCGILLVVSASTLLLTGQRRRRRRKTTRD